MLPLFVFLDHCLCSEVRCTPFTTKIDQYFKIATIKTKIYFYSADANSPHFSNAYRLTWISSSCSKFPDIAFESWYLSRDKIAYIHPIFQSRSKIAVGAILVLKFAKPWEVLKEDLEQAITFSTTILGEENLVVLSVIKSVMSISQKRNYHAITITPLHGKVS